jgi:hypothetical protein
MTKQILLFAAGLVVGGLVVLVLRPAPAEPPADDFIVIENEYGHWIYKKENGGLRPVQQEMSPAGLKAIWELQSDYVPTVITLDGESLLHFPMTRTDGASFQVMHHFYRMDDGKLVEVELQAAPK